MDTEINIYPTNKWRAGINQDGLYKERGSYAKRGGGEMAKNQNFPAHLQEKDPRGEDNSTMHEHHEKPTAWWLGPSLSSPRSTNDIVWAFLRANPTLLQFATNRVPTSTYIK